MGRPKGSKNRVHEPAAAFVGQPERLELSDGVLQRVETSAMPSESEVPPMPTFAPGLVPVFDADKGVWEGRPVDPRIVPAKPVTMTAPTDANGGPAIVPPRTVEPFADVERVDAYRKLVEKCNSGGELVVTYRYGEWRFCTGSGWSKPGCGPFSPVVVSHPDFHEACRRLCVLLSKDATTEPWMPCGNCHHIHEDHSTKRADSETLACKHGCGCRGWKR